MHSLELPVASPCAKLALSRGPMTWLEEFVDVSQHQLADAQSDLVAVKSKREGYRSRLDRENPWHGGFGGVSSRSSKSVVNHTSYVDLARDFFHHDMNCYLDACL